MSLLFLVSLGVFIPLNKARVKVPVNPRRKGYLGCLAFLSCLAWLGKASPAMATLAGLANLSTQPDDALNKPPQPRGSYRAAPPETK